MKYHLKYQKGLKPIRIPAKAKVTVLQSQVIAARGSVSEMLEGALHNARFVDQLRKKNPSSIAIALPYETRLIPVRELLPNIVQRLFRALPHLEAPSVTIIFGNGLHSPPNREAIHEVLASNIVCSCNVVTHVAGGARMKDFGVTRQGTPVRIDAAYGEAEFKMVIGRIEPHHFFGFTGGAQEAVLGCGSVEGVLHNHRLICDAPVGAPIIGTNPMREDLDEAGRMIGIDFAVDVVLNADKDVVRVFAGEPEAVLRQGAEACAALFGIGIDHRFDIVLGSIADSSHGSKVYQAMKSLSLICRAVKRGGNILLLAALQKDIGEEVYFDFLCPFVEPEEITRDFLNLGYAMGARRAELFGGMLSNCGAADFHDLERDITRHWHLRAADPSAIMAEWVDDFEGVPQVAVIPRADATYYYCDRGANSC